MKTISLSDITQKDFDEAAQAVSSGIKAYNRKLDTRSGTVLRDLLVDPSAAMDAVASGQIAEVRKSTSLARMKEAQDSGERVDQSDINAILSNFNIVPASGTKARGIVKVVISDDSVAYSIPEGAMFKTAEGLEFASDSQVVAARFEMSNVVESITSTLYDGAAGYFFLVPVTALEPGSGGNVEQGTAMSPETTIYSFVMAEAYKDFDGGLDTQSLESIMASIPSGLSIRGFVNKTAVEGMLRAEFDGGGYPVVDVSAVGYGNAAQRRDKHNLFGVGVGGRVDVYVRNFSDMFTITKTVRGRLEGEGSYRLSLSPSDFPGGCWIKSVSDPFASEGGKSVDVLESLAFDAVRVSHTSSTWHDFDGSAAEAFNTVWQGFDVTLREVPEDDGSGWSEERDFKVTAYCLPQAAELQAYVDRDDVRSVATDVVVRCPIICNVSVNAVVHYDPRSPVDPVSARSRIRSYINGLGFVGRITRSDIVQILKNMGAVSVDMPVQDMLYGSLHDANGTRHVLGGDALDVSSIEDGAAMLSRDTVVFAAEDRNIQIKMIPGN